MAYCLENASRCCRDATLGEDASRVRKGHAPADNAILNNIALAVVFHRGFRHLPAANRLNEVESTIMLALTASKEQAWVGLVEASGVLPKHFGFPGF